MSEVRAEAPQSAVRVPGDGRAAISLGILIGVLTGMSASPAVGSVLASIAAAGLGWATFWQGKGDEIDVAQRSASARRLSLFAASCLIASLAGLWVRTHDYLGVSPWAEVQELAELGIGPLHAAELVALARSKQDSDPSAGSFFADRQLSPLPTSLDPRRYSSASLVFGAWMDAGGAWKSLATRLEQLPDETQLAAAVALWQFLVESRES